MHCHFLHSYLPKTFTSSFNGKLKRNSVYYTSKSLSNLGMVAFKLFDWYAFLLTLVQLFQKRFYVLFRVVKPFEKLWILKPRFLKVSKIKVSVLFSLFVCLNLFNPVYSC